MMYACVYDLGICVQVAAMHYCIAAASCSVVMCIILSVCMAQKSTIFASDVIEAHCYVGDIG